MGVGQRRPASIGAFDRRGYMRYADRCLGAVLPPVVAAGTERTVTAPVYSLP